ncbi:MAG TPA: tetratricopeptide repeat protein [Rubrivivax sp.]|nr:tetratricopeptide repeat protein [Rubrivivax sp.]
MSPAWVHGAPFVPKDDAQVLATVPSRATDPRAAELHALQRAWRANPRVLSGALALAQRHFDEVAARGDPRHIGYAQRALQPWWDLPAPPPAVRVLRAKLVQFDHRFAEALADLDAALQAEPGNTDAWAWRTAIHMVQADYAEARRGCKQIAALAPGLIATACLAQVDAITGQAALAAAALRAALQAHPQASAEERLWALTRLAETEERRGEHAAAEAAFREALSLGLPDVYLQAAFADFLLDRKRAAEVMAQLQTGPATARADVLLLRLALAAQATRHADAALWADQLSARFAAARLRGDSSHRKEEARFLLSIKGDTRQALPLAQQNWAQQREPADARLLLEAALAAKDAKAAQPVLDWMQRNAVESVALQALARQIASAR